jgi:expansin
MDTGNQGRRRHDRRWLGVTAAAAVLAAAGLVTALAVPFHPGSRAAAGPARATPTASAHAIALPASGPPAAASSPARTAAPAATAPRTPAAAAQPAPPAGAPLAGRLQPGVTYRGVATAYSAGNGDGACLFGPAASLMIAAMNYTDYETARACGAYVQVRAANGAAITVMITNECPYPCAPGQLDLSQQAFAKLANPALGRIPITWKLLSPSMASTISIRYKTGSSRWWCGIQVIGHRNPVARLAVRTGSGWQELPRTGYNYFISAGGSGCGGAIRVTDIYGQQLTINGIALLPNVAQPTQAQFAQH